MVVQCCTPKSLSVLPERNAEDVVYITQSMHNKNGAGGEGGGVMNGRHGMHNNANRTPPTDITAMSHKISHF